MAPHDHLVTLRCRELQVCLNVRSHPALGVFSKGQAILRRGKNSHVPESRRSRDGQVGSFKGGTFYLAIRAGVPIVPITLNGTRGVPAKCTALVAVRQEPHLCATYQHLLARGKAKRQALVAAIRKLLRAIDGRFKDRQPLDGFTA